MNELMHRLYQDHRNLSRLFDMLEEQVGRFHPDSDQEPDLPLILDIVNYLDDYPKTYHHPLEEQAIAYMAERDLGESSTNKLIHEQHQHLEHDTERLARLFETVALDQPVAIDHIRSALDEYLSHSRKHLQAEEGQLFPVMEKILGDDDWRVIASRLPRRRDPLFTEDPDEAFSDLNSRL